MKYLLEICQWYRWTHCTKKKNPSLYNIQGDYSKLNYYSSSLEDNEDIPLETKHDKAN